MKWIGKIIPVASKWSLGEGLEEADNRAKKEIENIDHLFDPTAPKSREGYRLNSKGMRNKLRAKNKARKKEEADKAAAAQKQKEEAERKKRQANWRKSKGLN